MKPALALVDHSFHQQTRSSDFLRAYLHDHFTVTEYWDDSWRGGQTVTVDQLNRGQFSHIIFLQTLPPLQDLGRVQGRMVWVPMYDGVYQYDKTFWLQVTRLPLTVICFSRTLYDLIQQYGVDCHYLQYWLNPETVPMQTDFSTKRLFFWQRTDITWNEVKQLLGEQTLDQCILKLDPDPGHAAVYPSEQDRKRYHIEVVSGTLSRPAYDRLLERSNIFIAPRRYEGIGLSMLEAMARGMTVIALDHPTMNEYIKNDLNGLLCSEDFRTVNLEKIQQLGTQARADSMQGWKQWQLDQTRLYTILSKPVTLKGKMIMRQALKFIVVGGFSTVVNYAVFFLSYSYGQINYLLASGIGYVTGLTVGYFWNAAWTFREQADRTLVGRQTLRYVSVYSASLLMSLGLVYLLVHWLGMDPRWANIIAIGQATLTNFLGCKYYAFK